MWIHKHLLLMEKIPKSLTGCGEKVPQCGQFTAVSYNVDFQENGFILRNKNHTNFFLNYTGVHGSLSQLNSILASLRTLCSSKNKIRVTRLLTTVNS